MESEFFITSGIGIVCFVFVCLFSVMFFIKGKIQRLSSKMFTILLILTLVTIFIYITLGGIATYNINFAQIYGRFLVYMIALWEIFLTVYMFFSFREDNENIIFFKKNKKSIILISIIFLLINFLICYFGSFEYVKSDGEPYGMYGFLPLYFNIIAFVEYITIGGLIIYNRHKTDNLTKVLFILCIFYNILCYTFEFVMNEQINEIPFMMSNIIMFLYLSLESRDKFLLDEYNNSLKKEEESIKLKNDFIMSMSHQLRTPLNSVLGFSNSLLLNDNIDIDVLKEDTKFIKKSSSELLDLINNILDLSKIESQNDTLCVNNYNLHYILYELYDGVKEILLKNNIRLNIIVDENCPDELFGDNVKLLKILNTLLVNIINCGNNTDIFLNVYSKKIENEYFEFIFSIKNQTYFVNSEIFNMSFDDIIKLSNESKFLIDSYTLSIVVIKELMNIIGASFKFTSDNINGTQIIISLNQKIVGNKVVGNINDRIEELSISNNVIKDLSDKKVLIVDDKKINSIILKRYFCKYNLIPEISNNPVSAIDLIYSNNYDLVVINNIFDDMSGIEFVNKLNSSGNKLPFIIGIIDSIEEIDSECEYVGILQRPIKFNDLNKIVNSIFVKESL